MKAYKKLYSFVRICFFTSLLFTLCYFFDDNMNSDMRLVLGKVLLAADLIISFVCARLSYNYVMRQDRRRREQERSLDNMLRLANAKRDEARTAADQRSVFLSNMSHEIRTPINTVLGMNEMIIRDTDDMQIRRYAGNVARSGGMLLALINDILDFSKIDSGRLELVPIRYYTESTINDLVTMVKTRAEDKGLELILDISPELPSVLYGDDVRLRQIILNLLTNAVKYTHQGTVTLSVNGVCKDNFCQLHVSVKDTGIGIRKEDIGKLTMQFQRLDEQKNRNIEGAGLGLSITSRLLELMGSRLQVESVYGEGSEFWFDVEQKIADFTPVGEFMLSFNAQDQDESYSSLFTAPDARLLVVDDNSMNREVFEALLRETEVVIDQAESGRRCLEMIGENKYDIIFLDHMMPEMDGIETLHAMKAKSFHYNADTPVVALTANAVSGARENYLAEGFDDFLAKPIVPEKLERMIAAKLPPEKLGPGKAVGDRTGSSGIQDTDLPQIEGLDWNIARLHLPDTGLMLQSVRNFSRNITGQADALEEMLGTIMVYSSQGQDGEAMDRVMNDLRIQVHAMKSSANIIGLYPLAGCAALLEYAARDGRRGEVMDIAPHFLDEWRGYRQKLSVCFEDDQTGAGAEADPLMYRDALRQLVEAVNCFDVHLADEIMEWLRGFRLPEEAGGIFQRLEGAVIELEGDKCLELTEELASVLDK